MKARARALLAASFLSVAAVNSGGDAPARPPTEADRIKALPDEERQWLTEFVAPILLPEEKTVFLVLTEPYQREAFKLDFWARREKPDLPQPLGPGYRDRYEEVWKLAQEKYGGWRNDAGRMLLRYGEPAEIFQPVCGGEEVFNGLEVWTYNNLGYSGRGTSKYIFYRRFLNGPYRLWTLNDRDADVFRQNLCRRSFKDLGKDCGPPQLGDRCTQCEDRCRVYKAYLEILARQGSPLGAVSEQARLFEPVKVSTEGLDRQKDRWATTSNPKAKTIHVEGPSSSVRTGTPSPTPTPSPPPGPPRKLSADEVRDRIRQLEPKYREWLDLARPLLSEDELSLFLQIPPKQKDEFIQKFWKSRS
jgi:GWxTD domain-containing protein